MNTLKTIGKCILVLLAAVTAGSLLLFAVSFIPQKALFGHIGESVVQFEKEGADPHIYDFYSRSNVLDNHTDAVILLESYYLNDWDAVWENPYYYDNAYLMIDAVKKVAEENVPANHIYSRYWGGFRLVYRALLVGLNYPEIRHFLVLLFWILFLWAVYTFFKAGGLMSAAIFSIGMLLMKPEIISISMQFSCCFILALLAICLLPYLVKKSKQVVLFFFAIGCIIQFFDFYTTPVITLGLPLCLFLLLFRNETVKEKNLSILKSVIAWGTGYVAMWLSKLTLTQLFTEENAFGEAFASVANRIGTEKLEGLEYSYSIPKAFLEVARVFGTRTMARWLLIFALFAALIIICLIARKKSAGVTAGHGFIKALPFLLVCLLSVVWFALTPSPTVLHAYFQYRTIAVAVVAFPFFICSWLSPYLLMRNVRRQES